LSWASNDIEESKAKRPNSAHDRRRDHRPGAGEVKVVAMEMAKRFATDDQFGRFLQILESRDGRQDGKDLHPSNLWMCLPIHQFYPELQTVPVSGSAVDIAGPSSGDANLDPPDTSGFDQWGSRLLLGDVGQAKIDFPNAARRHRQILARAESIWTALLNRVEVGV
jgi:hypothetical protein